jgi:transglutaminase-like putative cysteine protease
VKLFPERDGLDRYLEDTETTDWQTPAVMEKARELGAEATNLCAAIRAIWQFVQQDILEPDGDRDGAVVCSASQVLAAGRGIDHARANLLVAMLRSRGIPAGFGYQKLRRGGAGALFVLAGFACVYLHDEERWVPLDVRQGGGAPPDLSDAHLSVDPDAELEEETFDVVFARPHRGVVDVLSRAPNLEHVRRFLPETL